MSVFDIVFVAVSVLVAGFISGVFGMAGGMVLIGALLLVMPVPAAMVLHGVTQMSSNGWRGVVWRGFVDWRMVLRFSAGLLVASALFFSVRYVPDRAVVLLCLGSVPFIVMLAPVPAMLQVDRPWGAEICGFANAVVQFVAGVSGPVLDAFFARSMMDRRKVVATKAACQTVAHFAKLVYFMHAGSQIGTASGDLWLFGLCVAMAVAGTSLSRSVLERLTDHQFRMWTRGILFVVGAIYIAQGLRLLYLR